jgi:NTE family protein
MGSGLRLLLPLLLTSVLVQGQVPRKRIGVALAGGGAKGLAHIGVLQWMEEHRIPIDAVAGTSMGGLVGGIFAGGRNSAEIRQFVNDIDWDVALGPGATYHDLSFRRKQDQRSFPALFEMGFRDWHFRLPGGLNAGHQVELLLDQVGFNYSEMTSFDDLPTPFRAVAADLRTAERVVFQDGSLSLALRATMSLPAIFEPVPYQNMLLIDGGTVDNLPADLVRGMNVDVVVAVDLGIETIAMDKPLSLLDVASRSITIMMYRNTIESLKFADVVVKPSVAAFNTLDFRTEDKIVDMGYQAAEAVAAELLPYAVSEDEWKIYVENRRKKTRPAGFTPEFIQLNGVLSGDGGVNARKFESLVNKPFDREAMEKSLTRIVGLGVYQSAGYSQKQVDGKRGLAIKVTPKSYGPPFVRPLFLLDSGQAGSASFTLAARIVAFDVFSRNSEWRTDLSFGRIKSAGTEYYQFLGWRGLFAAGRGFYSKEQQLIVDDGATLATYNVSRAGGGFDLGYNFGRFMEIRTGIEMDQLNGKVEVGFPILPTARGTEGLWNTRFRLNDLNSGTIPTRGWLIDSEFDWNFKTPDVFFMNQPDANTGSYGQAWSQFMYARPFADKWSTLVRVLAGGSFAGQVQPFSEFRLGGPLRLGALEVGELRGANLAFASAAVLRRFRNPPSSSFGIGRVYGSVGYEGGDAFDSKISIFNNGTAAVLAETVAGVVTVGYSYGEQGRHGFFFSLGRTFGIGVRNSFDVR